MDPPSVPRRRRVAPAACRAAAGAHLYQGSLRSALNRNEALYRRSLAAVTGPVYPGSFSRRLSETLATKRRQKYVLTGYLFKPIPQTTLHTSPFCQQESLAAIKAIGALTVQ